MKKSRGARLHSGELCGKLATALFERLRLNAEETATILAPGTTIG